MSRRFLGRVITATLVLLVAAGCAGGAGVASPAPVQVRTEADAIARVIAAEPRLTGIQPFDSGLIGQSSWFVVAPASGVAAFVVDVRVGWGDCEAGCINEHSWVYAVLPDGTARVQSEGGPPVPPGAWPSPEAGQTGGTGQTGLSVTAVAGPVCPVETVPPDPNCAPRPVANATVVIRDGTGAEMARPVTDSDGSFTVELPPGRYTLEPQPVEGLMGTAASFDATVDAGAVTSVQLEYDTGIR